MDYDIINQVYEEIISIVNDYARKNNCEYEVARKLSFALLGYYLVMGPEIFKKLNILLDSVRIYEFISNEDYQKKAIEISPKLEENKHNLRYNPITIWDYRYDSNNNFLGGIPNILYMRDKTIDNVLSISHEMSHGLEGVSASVESEDEDYVYINQGFTHLTVDKESNRFRVEGGSGFIELVTSSLENRILNEFLKLDVQKIDSSLLREFLGEIKVYKSKNVMSRSYDLLNSIFKDLTDNPEFYDLIKDYFYDNDENGFKVKYESYGNGLIYKVLKDAAEHLSADNLSVSDAIYYGDIIKRQAENFNKATNYEPDKKLLILV